MPRRYASAAPACLAACLLALAGCGLFGSSVEARAAAYYNYMVGRSPKTPYTSFLSPAYKSTFQRDSLRALDQFSRSEIAANERYPAARAADITVAAEGRFAFTAVDPALGDAYASLAPQRWVRDGRGWYLYMGSDAEVQAYGAFPPQLYPPRPAAGLADAPLQ